MKSITPFLWFDGNLQEALDLYISVFPDAEVNGTSPGPDGTVMMAELTLAGQDLKALDGGAQFLFTEAISLFVECDDQAEVDRLWDALTADGGEEGRCGWLKDRFGLSWQIVPSRFMELMSTDDGDARGRTMNAMQGMAKMDVAALEAVHAG